MVKEHNMAESDDGLPGTDSAVHVRSERRTMSSAKFREAARSRMSPFHKSQFTPKRLPSRLTPKSRRLVASTRREVYGSIEEEKPGFEGILKKQWKIYSLSPLYNFKPNRGSFIKYGRSLDAALSQAQSSSADPLSSGSEKSTFSLYEDLKFSPDDPAALRIQVMERNPMGQASKLVLEALLVCVEPSSSPIPDHVRSHFTSYPVVLVSGTKARTTVVFEWLERHFDCRSDPLTLVDSDLRYILACCSPFMAVKAPPVLLQYSLGQVCDGIGFINCNLEAHYCKQLWERLFSSPSAKAEMFEGDVDKFVSHIEGLLEHLMSIVFKKLNLSEVGTSAAYVSYTGKIKIFSPSAVYTVLHILCEIVNDRLMQIAPREQ